VKLDAAVLAAPVLDHRGLDLDAAERVIYILRQRFRYAYAEPVKSLRQRLVIVPPPRHGDQHRREHVLDVSGAAAARRVRRDGRGNVVAWLHADAVPHTIEFRLAARIERVRADGPAIVPRSALSDPGLLRPTRLTAADDRIRDLASGLAGGGDTPMERAARICERVHSALRYQAGVTTVRTTAAEALAGGQGVCQDFAHVMLAVCHVIGLPARYVSGHLLGQGGTHAWVEVLVPRGGRGAAAAFDPCNGRRADNSYLTIATGRDYRNVAPASGSYVGAPGHTLTTSRELGILSAA
jgi:transglutaminase-like putative cysteine protease